LLFLLLYLLRPIWDCYISLATLNIFINLIRCSTLHFPQILFSDIFYCYLLEFMGKIIFL
ncbi:MAG: hypothetical protein J7F05_22350, partial [Trichodesmium erythraeum GBRTRLIN201]|nr:hypothetical protein [Trichodesmium erythraeum GBRTRLIN201]